MSVLILISIQSDLWIRTVTSRWVTSLCAHPTNPSLFLSGGHQKGIVCWDTRVGSVVCEYFAEFGEVEDMTFLDVEMNPKRNE